MLTCLQTLSQKRPVLFAYQNTDKVNTQFFVFKNSIQIKWPKSECTAQ